MLYGLDLFSGYGGITLALSEWVRPIAYCEIEHYAQGILLSRMSKGQLPNAPIWDDINTFPSEEFKGKVDIIYGGFPCQDISVAGNGKGLAGERSGLFFKLCELVKEIKPTFVFLENVPAVRTRGLREVVREFTNLGYDCRWTRVSAAEVGAPHRRERWFLLAHSNGKRAQSSIRDKNRPQNRPKDSKKRKDSQFKLTQQSWWEVEPSVGRVVDGCPSRVDRLKALGNGVVPLQAKKAFMKLM